MGHGGKRPGAGRKPKADEEALQAKLSPLDDLFYASLKKGLQAGEYNFCKMFAEYRLGKPKEKIEHTGELQIIWNEILNNGADSQANESS